MVCVPFPFQVPLHVHPQLHHPRRNGLLLPVGDVRWQPGLGIHATNFGCRSLGWSHLAGGKEKTQHKCDECYYKLHFSFFQVGLSTLFPSSLVWGEAYMLMSGQVVALICSGLALGELAIPQLFTRLTIEAQTWLGFAMLGATTICSGLFVCVFLMAKKQGSRYVRTLINPGGGSGGTAEFLPPVQEGS